jgi:hypothetical protein
MDRSQHGEQREHATHRNPHEDPSHHSLHS